MSVATEHIVDVLGADAAALCDVTTWRALCERVCRAAGVTIVGAPQWHSFPATPAGPGGVTGLYLLSESHLAVHTWPERGVATINLCCCRRDVDVPWEPLLRDVLRAARVVVRTLPRGGP